MNARQSSDQANRRDSNHKTSTNTDTNANVNTNTNINTDTNTVTKIATSQSPSPQLPPLLPQSNPTTNMSSYIEHVPALANMNPYSPSQPLPQYNQFLQQQQQQRHPQLPLPTPTQQQQQSPFVYRTESWNPQHSLSNVIHEPSSFSPMNYNTSQASIYPQSATARLPSFASILERNDSTRSNIRDTAPVTRYESAKQSPMKSFDSSPFQAGNLASAMLHSVSQERISIQHLTSMESEPRKMPSMQSMQQQSGQQQQQQLTKSIPASSLYGTSSTQNQDANMANVVNRSPPHLSSSSSSAFVEVSTPAKPTLTNLTNYPYTKPYPSPYSAHDKAAPAGYWNPTPIQSLPSFSSSQARVPYDAQSQVSPDLSRNALDIRGGPSQQHPAQTYSNANVPGVYQPQPMYPSLSSQALQSQSQFKPQQLQQQQPQQQPQQEQSQTKSQAQAPAPSSLLPLGPRTPTTNKSRSKKNKSFTCPEPGCGMIFSRRDNMKVHQRRHTGEMPYKCEFPGCNKLFRWKSSMNHHQSTHEAPSANSPPSPNDGAAGRTPVVLKVDPQHQPSSSSSPPSSSHLDS